jgi:phosphate transport system substrate-binding protein
MKRIIGSVALLAITAIAVAAGSSLTGKYTFGGSTTVAPIAYAAIEAFQKENPAVSITYESVGSSTGIKQLLAGTYSLAGSSRDLKPEEIAAGAKEIAIGLDGLAVVVNKSITIANLTIAQLGKIYTGSISNWKEVGGPNVPIVVVNRDETSGTFGAFWEIVCEKTYGKTPAYRKDALVARENGEVAAKVASTPGAIGYIGMAFVDEVTKAGGKELYIDGVAPTVANVVSKKYPISRFIYLVTKGEPQAGTVEKAFVDYVLSAKGQAIVKASGYIQLPKK